jgi:putative MATE family efflux protein
MQGTYSYKDIWKISYPLIIGGMAQAVINVTDSAFLGRVSEVAMGASAISGLFFILLLMLGFGFGIGSQIIIARLDGEQKHNEIGGIAHQSLYFLVALSLVLIAICLFTGKIFLSWFVQSPEVLEACIQYLNVRSFGFFFVFILIAFRSFYSGTADTKIISYTTIVMALANIILNYCLVFGNFGFPEMGIAGSALSSTISEALAAIYMVLYTIYNKKVIKFNLLKLSLPDFNKFMEIFRLGAPIMIQMCASVTSWFIFFLIIEKMGQRELAVSNITRNVYMILMVPLLGFGSATNTLVSNIIGQGKKHEVIPLIKRIIVLSLALSVIVVGINAIYPYMTIYLFTNMADVAQESVILTYVISGSLLLFSVAYMLLSGVSGTGNTLVTLIIEIFTVLFYLIATYYLAVEWKMSLAVVWSVEYIYFALMGGMSFLYLKYGGWRK